MQSKQSKGPELNWLDEISTSVPVLPGNRNTAEVCRPIYWFRSLGREAASLLIIIALAIAARDGLRVAGNRTVDLDPVARLEGRVEFHQAAENAHLLSFQVDGGK